MMAKKAQAAMEFLMTYGWAILIMLVVVAILFTLGIFSPFDMATNNCAMPTGFSCYSFMVYQGGSLVLDIGQSTGRTILVTGVACDEGAAAHWVEVNKTIESTMRGSIDDVTCYNSDNSTPQDGDVYRGNVYINYTDIGTGYTHHVQGEIAYTVVEHHPTPIPSPNCTRNSECTSGFCNLLTGRCASFPPCPPACGDGVCTGDENPCNCRTDCDWDTPCNLFPVPCEEDGPCDYSAGGGANSYEHCPEACPLNCSGYAPTPTPTPGISCFDADAPACGGACPSGFSCASGGEYCYCIADCSPDCGTGTACYDDAECSAGCCYWHTCNWDDPGVCSECLECAPSVCCDNMCSQDEPDTCSDCLAPVVRCERDNTEGVCTGDTHTYDLGRTYNPTAVSYVVNTPAGGIDVRVFESLDGVAWTSVGGESGTSDGCARGGGMGMYGEAVRYLQIRCVGCTFDYTSLKVDE